jgi:hypothetical protein
MTIPLTGGPVFIRDTGIYVVSERYSYEAPEGKIGEFNACIVFNGYKLASDAPILRTPAVQLCWKDDNAPLERLKAIAKNPFLTPWLFDWLTETGIEFVSAPFGNASGPQPRIYFETLDVATKVNRRLLSVLKPALE